jgi:hypothetical protein
MMVMELTTKRNWEGRRGGNENKPIRRKIIREG